MFLGQEMVRVRRWGKEQVIPAAEVLFNDEFVHSGAWWRFATIKRCLMDLEDEDKFRFNNQWFQLEKIGSMLFPIVLATNTPLGEPVPDRLPPVIKPMDDVEYLVLTMVERI